MPWCCWRQEQVVQHDQDLSQALDHASSSTVAHGGHLLHQIFSALTRTQAAQERDWLRAFQHTATYLRSALGANYVGIAATNRLDGFECAYSILASDCVGGLSLPTCYLPHLPRSSHTGQQQDECTWDRTFASQKSVILDINGKGAAADMSMDWQVLLHQDCTWFACVPIVQGGIMVGAIMVIQGDTAPKPLSKNPSLSVQDLETIGFFLGQTLMTGKEPALAVGLLAAVANQPDIHSLVHAISEHLADAARIQTQLPMACRVALVHSMGDSVVMFGERSSAPTPIHSSRASQSSRLYPGTTTLATSHSAQQPQEQAGLAHAGGSVRDSHARPSSAGPFVRSGMWDADGSQGGGLQGPGGIAATQYPTLHHSANRHASSTLGTVSSTSRFLPFESSSPGLAGDSVAGPAQPHDESSLLNSSMKDIALDKYSGVLVPELIAAHAGPGSNTQGRPGVEDSHGDRIRSSRDSFNMSFGTLYTTGSEIQHASAVSAAAVKALQHQESNPAAYSTGPSVLSQRVHSFLSQETGGASGSLYKANGMHDHGVSTRLSSGLVSTPTGTHGASNPSKSDLTLAEDIKVAAFACMPLVEDDKAAPGKVMRKSSSAVCLQQETDHGSKPASGLASHASAHTARTGTTPATSSLLPSVVYDAVIGKGGVAHQGGSASKASSSACDPSAPAWSNEVSLRLATMNPTQPAPPSQPAAKEDAQPAAGLPDQEERKQEAALPNQMSITNSWDRNSPAVNQMGRRGMPASVPRHAIVVPLRNTLLQKAADRGKGVVVPDVAAYLHKRPGMLLRDIIMAHASLPVGSLILSVYNHAFHTVDGRASVSLSGLHFRNSSHRRSSVATLEESMPSYHGYGTPSLVPTQTYQSRVQSFGRTGEVSKGGSEAAGTALPHDANMLSTALLSEHTSARGSEVSIGMPLLAVYITYPHTLPAVLLKGLLAQVELLMQLVGPLVHQVLRGPRLGPEWKALHLQLMEQQPGQMTPTSGVDPPAALPPAWHAKHLPSPLIASPITLKPHLPLTDLSSPFSVPVCTSSGMGAVLSREPSLPAPSSDSVWPMHTGHLPASRIMSPTSDGGARRPASPGAEDGYTARQIMAHRLESVGRSSKPGSPAGVNSPRPGTPQNNSMTLAVDNLCLPSNKPTESMDPPTFTNNLQSLSGLPAAGTQPHLLGRAALLSEVAAPDAHTGNLSFTLEMASSPDRVHALLAGLQDKLSNHRRSGLTTARLAEQGKELSNLKLSERIGKGGYGTVYHGTLNGQEVAIKVVLAAPDDGSGRAGASQLRSAMELAAATIVAHPSIVQVVTHFTDVMVLPNPDFIPGFNKPCSIELLPPPPEPAMRMPTCTSQSLLVQAVTGGSPRDAEGSPAAATASGPPSPMHAAGQQHATVICMEYCDGGSLADAVSRGVFKQRIKGGWGASVPDLPVITATLLEVASALKHLHALRLVHCDVKASNVLLKSSPRDPRGFTTKLSDFGLVSVLAEDGTMPAVACSDPDSSEGGSCPGHPVPTSIAQALINAAAVPRRTAPPAYHMPITAATTGAHLHRARSSNMPRTSLPYQSSTSRLSRALDDDDHVASLINSITTQQSAGPSDLDGNSAVLSDPALAQLLDPQLVFRGAPVRLGMPAGSPASAYMQPVAENDQHTMLGTYSHMAPEVIAGGPRCAALDIYSFGVLMAEMVMGTELLYLGMSSQQVMQRVAAGTLRPQLPPHLPPEYRSLAEECWQQDPGMRPSAEQLVNRIKRLTGLWPLGSPAAGARSTPTSARGPAPPKRSGTWGVREAGGYIPAPRYSMAQQAPTDDMAFPLHIL